MKMEENELEYETTYGHCIAKNPYWFLPDIECNTDAELINWRHAIWQVDDGTYEAPEHYYWKQVGGITVHGHRTTWGMGVSAFSEKGMIWDPENIWILKAAKKKSLSDKEFLELLREVREYRNELLKTYREAKK